MERLLYATEQPSSPTRGQGKRFWIRKAKERKDRITARFKEVSAQMKVLSLCPKEPREEAKFWAVLLILIDQKTRLGRGRNRKIAIPFL